MSTLTLTLHQSPDHTVQVGDTVFVRLDAQEGKLWKAGYIERR